MPNIMMLQKKLPEEFWKGLAALEQIEIGALEEFIIFLNEQVSLEELPISKETLDPVVQKIGVDKEHLIDCVNSAVIILQAEKAGDSIDDILVELAESGKIKSESFPQMKDKIEMVKKLIFDSIQEYANQMEAISKTFPILDYYSTSCTLATYIEPGFNNTKDNPDTYDPKIVYKIPIILFQFDINKFGSFKRESFGVTEKQLKEIINHLNLAYKELKEFKRDLSLD